MIGLREAAWPRAVAEKWFDVVAGFGPILAALAAVGATSLYGHAPHDFAAGYSAPTTYANAYQQEEYAAVARPGGGWDMLYVDSHKQAVFRRVSGSGRTLAYQRVAGGGETIGQPTLAEQGRDILGAWVKEENGALTLWAAYLGAHRSAPFRLNPGGGLVEHPYLLPAPAGLRLPSEAGLRQRRGFLLLFEWQHPNGFDIFLASLPRGARHPALLRRLTRSPEYGFYPRGAIDGSGALDTIHLELCCREKTWLVEFQRIGAPGTPLGRPRILDSISQTVIGTPNQWGLDVGRDADGSVWAAWEGEQWVSVARWDSRGQMVLRATRVFFGSVDLATPALALVPLPRHRAEVYFASQNVLGSHLTGLEVDATGRRIGQERVEYSSEGTASYPRAGAVGGRLAVLWEKLTDDRLGAVIEGSAYGAGAPSLAERLGIGIGNAAGNLAMIVLGALVLGALLTMGNLVVLLLLILAWLPIRRFAPERARWPLYLGLLGAVLAAIFAMPSAPPGFVLFVSGLGRPYGWLAVAGAVFVSYWTGRCFFAHQEPMFRAVAMGIVAFYFVTVIYAATAVQGELGRV